MKILVTGANGYLGQGVVKALLDNGHSVVAADFKTNYVDALLETNGLAVGKDHQFKGRYDAEKNAVVISLEENEFENERQSKIGLSL